MNRGPRTEIVEQANAQYGVLPPEICDVRRILLNVLPVT